MSEHDDATIDLILADLVDQQLSGREPDVEAAAAEHPEHADEIRARFTDLKKLTSLWRTLSSHSSGPAGVSGAKLPPDAKLGDYTILRELGRGGMGTVYLARQESLARLVAVKIVPQADTLSPATRQRFLREARALAGVSHPNIVPVYSAGEELGVMYIAMEYVEGVSLADLISAVRGRQDSQKASDVWGSVVSAGPIPPAGAPKPAKSVPPDVAVDAEYLQTALQAVCDVAGALAAAHKRGIVHRDVKPANIIIDSDGHARLLDFGLASIHTEPLVTVSGEFFGTPNYVSPEQAGGRRDQIGVHTDVYSLGATLYECLTLRPPFDGESVGEVLSRVLHDDPAPLRSANPTCSRELEVVVMKALCKDPGGRYASMTALAEDLQRVLASQPVSARGPALTTRAGKRIRRNPLPAVLTAVLLAAGLGAASGLWWTHRKRPASSTPPPAVVHGSAPHRPLIAPGADNPKTPPTLDPPGGQQTVSGLVDDPLVPEPTSQPASAPSQNSGDNPLAAQIASLLNGSDPQRPPVTADPQPSFDPAEAASVRRTALASLNMPLALKWMQANGLAADPMYDRYMKIKPLRTFLAAYLANCSPDQPLEVTLRDSEGTFTVNVYTAVEDAALVLASEGEKVRTSLDALEMPVRTRILQAAVRKGTPVTSPLRIAVDLYLQESREAGLLDADFR